MGLTQKLGTIPLAIQTDSSNNVGIGGAANASYKLAVTGASLFTGAGTFSSRVTASDFVFTGTGPVFQGVPSAGTSAQYGYFQNTGGVFYFGRDNSTASEFGVGAYSTILWNSGNNPLVIATNNTERFRIAANGNVGIGETNPSRKLTVSNAANGDVALFTNTVDADLKINLTSGVTLLTPSTGILAFGTSSTERMRIASGGQVLIGTTSTTNIGGDKLFVYGNNNVFTSQTTGGQGRWTMIGWNSADSGDNSLIEFGVNSTYSAKGSVDYARGSNVIRYNTTSDANLKTIIGDSDLQKSVQILKSTRIREYSWKDDKTNKPQIGVIAQELYETFTGAVSKGSDNELFGTEEYKNWSVDKTAFTFHLIAGWQMHEKLIKEQQEIINQLSAKVTALENK